MIINGNKINIFNPEYAFNRIANAESSDSKNKYTALKDLIDRLPSYEPVYKTGDAFDYQERPYHKYPGNIAVLVEKDGVFGLQTFSHSKVGEYYADILKQSDEVYKFFRDAREDIIVLENNGGRQLTGSYDLLIKLVVNTNTARKNLEDSKTFINNYTEKLNTLFSQKRFYPDFDMGAVLAEAEEKAEKVLVDMQEMIANINESLYEELNDMYLYPDDIEANCIAFGLYYGFLRNFQYSIVDSDFPNRETPFMQELHTFIKEHKGIVNKYCEYMDFPPYESDVVKQLVHDNGLLRDRWITAANDIL